MPVRVMVVVHSKSQVFQIARTLHASSRFPGRLNGRKQKSDKDADNGNHDEKFDQRKRSSLTTFHRNSLPLNGITISARQNEAPPGISDNNACNAKIALFT